MFNLCLKISRDSASIYSLRRPSYSPICLTVRIFSPSNISIFNSSILECKNSIYTHLLLCNIRPWRCFLSPLWPIQPNDKCPCYFIALYHESQKVFTLFVSEFTHRDWHELMGRWAYIFKYLWLCYLIKGSLAAIFNLAKSMQVRKSSRLSFTSRSSAVILIY